MASSNMLAVRHKHAVTLADFKALKSFIIVTCTEESGHLTVRAKLILEKCHQNSQKAGFRFLVGIQRFQTYDIFNPAFQPQPAHLLQMQCYICCKASRSF